MEVIAIGVFFILGAIAASFAGVLAARLNTGESFVRGRSRCDRCGAILAPRALVPILSFVSMRGRAACCAARISVWSPATELLLGVVFAAAFLKLGFSLTLVCFLAALVLVLALVLYDFAHHVLPPALLAPFIALSALTALFEVHAFIAFIEALLVAVALATILAAIHFFSGGRAMGLADAPFTLGLALLFTGSAVSGFVFSFWIGAVIGIGVLLKRPSGSRMGVEVPFAPFLAAGFLLAYFTQWHPFALIGTFLH